MGRGQRAEGRGQRADMSSGAKSRNVGKFRWNFDDSDHLAFRDVLIVVAWHKKARTRRAGKCEFLHFAGTKFQPLPIMQSLKI